mmetsp:Transcript_86297/g.239295  ORF Transcript_86297/g.239295 Transcript_86297/m.239295 type:complete len:201 (+) Transcript_86297:59-661(+)
MVLVPSSPAPRAGGGATAGGAGLRRNVLTSRAVGAPPHRLWRKGGAAAQACRIAAAAALRAAARRAGARRRWPGPPRLASQATGPDARAPVPRVARLVGWCYFFMGIAFAVSLVFTLRQHPLFPFKAADAACSFAWLLQTIWDYYATALCLCGVIIATEGWGKGALWSASILLLGSSFSCAYIGLRMFQEGSIALRRGAR